MPKRESIPVTIYQLDERLSSDDSFLDLTHRVIRTINASRANKFALEEISTTFPEKFKVRLYQTHKTDPPTWKDFLKPILLSDSSLLVSLNTTYSFICFIEHSNYIYAITGGTGSFALERFINNTFGLDILTKIINEDDKVIKEIKERDVTGAILGQTKFYRGDQSIISNAEFGKIYKLVSAEINRHILIDVLGFSPKELKRKTSRCLVKESFKISKSITFQMLLNLIEKFSYILSLENKFELNKVSLISRRKSQNHPLLKNLNNYLVEKIYIDVNSNLPLDFDFCHTKYEEYHLAERYAVYFEGENYFNTEEPLSFEDLITKLKKDKKFHDQSVELFSSSVLNLNIESYDDRGDVVTNGRVIEHLHGEIKFDNSTYFFVDKEWYKIQDDFLMDLNKACREVVKQCWSDDLICETFDTGKDESEFNLQFCGQERKWTLDTITAQNIEVCDILIDNGEVLNLVHVKKGFNNRMRDLAAQVIIAAKRIQQTIRSDNYYLDLLEKKVKGGLTSSSSFSRKLALQEFPANGFKHLFNRRDEQIAFCLAFVDTAEEDRCFKENVEAFDSNIAKYALVNLKKEIQNMGFRFKLIQIGRQ